MISMKFPNLFLFLYILYCIIIISFSEEIPKCGIYNLGFKPKIITGKPFNETEKARRRLDVDADGFKEFKIYFDPTNIKNEVKKYNVEQYLDVYLNSIQKVIDILQKLLRIKPLKYVYSMNGEFMKSPEVEDFDRNMFGDGNEYFNFNDLGYDLIIFGRLFESGALASAGPYRIEDDGRPLTGTLNINYNTDYSKGKSQEYFESVLIHEFTHVLGFWDYYFTNFFHNTFYRIDSSGVNRAYINSPKVIEVGKKYFDCPSVDGIALEDSGQEGTAGTHWEARILLGDYMNGYIFTEEQAVSEFTLALLEDSGYYKANYYTGGLMRFGKHKGCEFLYGECVNKVTHTINPFFENEFYDSIHSIYQMDASCSSGRQSRAYYAWWSYPNLAEEFSHYVYFENQAIGGFGPANYCPVALGFGDGDTAYYTGQCSSKGNDQYGQSIFYTGQNGERLSYKSADLTSITGETHSETSFCFLSSSIKREFQNSDFFSKVPRAICYKIFCSERSLTVQINDDYVVCPRAGGKIEIEGYEGYFLCPDYNLMCSGTIICNDMFDCVNKKSELKESSYIYDYEIKTSQNTEDAEIVEADDINNYELSENAICPIYCKQCKENKICIKCKNDYEFVGNKNNAQIECVEKSQLLVGYYKLDNDIYYKCIPKCDICSNDNTCDKCSDTYDYIDNRCLKKIENCEEYDEYGICDKCIENYAFEKDGRDECKSLEHFSNYYSMDNGISYYPCNDNIENCQKCNYNIEKSSPECNLCDNDYALAISENKCYKKDEIIENKNYYLIDNTHTKKCSEEILNCIQCENGRKCIKCIDDYYLFNDEGKICYIKYALSEDDSFLNEEKTTYYSCNSKYHSVKNCKSCSNKDTCSLCEDGYIFINDDKTKCYKLTDIDGKYIKDKNNNTNYIKCSDFISNCELCNDNFCTSCKKGYVFIDEDYEKCVEKKSINLGLYYTNDFINYYSCENDKYKNDERCQKPKPQINPETSFDNTINSISLLFIFVLYMLLY